VLSSRGLHEARGLGEQELYDCIVVGAGPSGLSAVVIPRSLPSSHTDLSP
jgi:alkyl hydroperoxide reductase subunit AhpF